MCTVKSKNLWITYVSIAISFDNSSSNYQPHKLFVYLLAYLLFCTFTTFFFKRWNEKIGLLHGIELEKKWKNVWYFNQRIECILYQCFSPSQYFPLFYLWALYLRKKFYSSSGLFFYEKFPSQFSMFFHIYLQFSPSWVVFKRYF